MILTGWGSVIEMPKHIEAILIAMFLSADSNRGDTWA